MRENQIYTSTDYDSFVFRPANRDVDMKHVKRISESMKADGWKGAPIEVSEIEGNRFQIEDGQHRYMACRMTNTPVKFMVVKPKTVYDIAEQNSIKKGWTGGDFIKAYADDGNYSYKRLKNLSEEFKGVTLTDILAVVSDNGKYRANLKKGYMNITDAKYYMAREVLKSLEMLSESLKIAGVRTQKAYKKALTLLLKHQIIDTDRMVDKLDKYGRMLLPPTATSEQAIMALETLYNYHQRGNIVLFREALRNRK